MMDRETVRNMYSFYSKNKIEKLVHVVGFIIRIYHDAWSPERQILHVSVQNSLTDLLHHNISWTYTKRPRDRQSASWRQKPNI